MKIRGEGNRKVRLNKPCSPDCGAYGRLVGFRNGSSDCAWGFVFRPGCHSRGDPHGDQERECFIQFAPRQMRLTIEKPLHVPGFATSL
jgi:hypothetical protein